MGGSGSELFLKCGELKKHVRFCDGKFTEVSASLSGVRKKAKNAKSKGHGAYFMSLGGVLVIVRRGALKLKAQKLKSAISSMSCDCICTRVGL